MRNTFEFIAGALSLDFVDTLAGRSSQARELLREPSDLSDWVAASGLGRIEGVSGAQLRRARDLREAIYQALSSAIDGQAIPDEAIAAVNAAASRPDLRPQFIDGEMTLVAPKPLDAALSRIAADAIENIAPEKRERLRRCSECRMLFRDNSRPGKRQWCSSASGCGNRAKVRRHRANVKKSETP